MSTVHRNGGMHRLQLGLAASIVMVAFVGCGSQSTSQSSPAPGSAGAANAGEVHLTLAEFQLVDAQGRPLSMSADGTITSHEGPWGRVHEDGTVTSSDGALHGKLLKTGSVVDAQGKEIATIADDGSAKVGKTELHFDADGKVVGGDSGQAMQLHATDPKVRRTAMLVLIMTEAIPLAK